jgi:hypothetical protein
MQRNDRIYSSFKMHYLPKRNNKGIGCCARPLTPILSQRERKKRPRLTSRVAKESEANHCLNKCGNSALVGRRELIAG